IVLTGKDGSSGGSGLGVSINNSLMANVQYPISIYTAAAGTIYYCTFNQSVQVVTFSGTYASLAAINSVFANVNSLDTYLSYDDDIIHFCLTGNNNGFYASPQFGNSQFVSASSPFQTQGAGGFYLAA